MSELILLDLCVYNLFITNLVRLEIYIAREKVMNNYTIKIKHYTT